MIYLVDPLRAEEGVWMNYNASYTELDTQPRAVEFFVWSLLSA